MGSELNTWADVKLPKYRTVDKGFLRKRMRRAQASEDAIQVMMNEIDRRNQRLGMAHRSSRVRIQASVFENSFRKAA